MLNSLQCVAAASLALLFLVPPLAQDEAAFARTTIDVGVVVTDIEVSAKFYGEALGFREVPGFEVGADFCSDAGLTEGKPLAVRVFVLGEGDTATKIKLMEVADTEPARSDNAFVHSQLGFSYLTVFVTDLDASLARLAKAEVRPLAKGPVPLGEGASTPHLALVRDPDGNLIELLGPRP